jgi:sec-independent protein translocase protein TatA
MCYNQKNLIKKELRNLMPLGVPELLIILAIIIILFGVGRVSKIGGELGEAIGNFRKGMQKSDDDKAKNEE